MDREARIREGRKAAVTDHTNKPMASGFWRRIRGKLISLLLLMLIPMLLVQAYDTYNKYQAARAEELKANLEISRSVAKTFEAFVWDVLREELAIGIAITSSGALTPDHIVRLLAESCRDNPAIRDFSWVDSEGVFIYSSNPAMVGANNRDRAYFRDIAGGREWTVGELVLARTTGEPVFGISRGIRNENGGLLGVVVATAVPARLDAVLSVERSKGGAINIVDNKGMLVYRYPAGQFSWEQRNWLRQFPGAVSRSLRGEEFSEVVYADFQGENRIIGASPVYFIGWAAIAGRTEEIVMAAITSTLAPQAILFSLIVIAAFVTALFLSRSISRPLEQLRSHAASLGKDHAYPPAEIAGPVELEELALSFNLMAEKLRAREQSLQEQREWLEVTLTSIGDAVLATDSQARVTFLNPAAEALTGWRRREVLGRPVQEVFRIMDDRTREPAEDIVGRALREGIVIGAPYGAVLARSDGREVPVEHNAAPIKDGAGNILGVVLVLRDVTEKRHSIEALQESERKNRFLADIIRVSSQPFAVGYPDGRIGLVNRAFEHLTGYSSEELQSGEGFVRFTPPEWVPTTLQKLEELHGTGKPVRYEKEIARKDGSRAPVEILVHLVSDPDGKPLYYYSFVTDITERKLMEAEQARLLAVARQRSAETEAVFEAMTDAVLIYDSNMDVVRVNSMFIPTYGFDPVGLNVREIIRRTQCRWPDGRPFLIEDQPTPRALSGETVLSQRFLITRVDGVEMALETSANPLRIGDRITGTVTVWHDVTKRREMEEALRKSRDELEMRVRERTVELERSNQALRDFASIASHDMKEPLRKVISFGNLLRQKYGDSLGDTGGDYLKRMLGASERMQTLLTSLLEYSKASMNREPFREVDLYDLVHEVLSDLEVRIRRTGGEVQVGKLPLLAADPTQMRQLFQNLIGNALKFHKEGERPLVKVRCTSVDDLSCRIVVEDNGIGFDESYLDRIFAPFQRLHGRSSQYEGTGMGLAICKKIVEQHGGCITARSEQGKGAAFIIDLPVNQPELEMQPGRRPS